MSIDAMKQALEALETLNSGDTYKTHNAATALRAAIEQAEKQEPAWVEVTTNTGDKFILDAAVEADKIKAAKDVGLSVVPLYTAPPQREWVGLTPEETKEISLANRPYVVDMVAALEQRLKEKNT